MAGILLVHGGWHGPWCWDGVAERLTGHGHRVGTVRLRGHDGPAGRIWHRVHHHVEDVGAAAARFAEPPVLVGHSMGGLAVQKYLERGPARGMSLLATVPRRGRWGPSPAWPPATRRCWPRPP
jgi:pimeloyl-ACP methyl ester carboxylesterase